MSKRNHSKGVRTNAMRLLDRDGINYKVHTFSSEIRSTSDVARAVGIPEDRVFKTLVVISDDKPTLAMLAGTDELDVKAMAQCIGAKRCQMASYTDAEHLTGLKVGGISALALRHRGWDVYLDAAGLAYERVLVSAGKRGVNLEIDVQDLITATEATVCELARGATDASSSTH